MSRIRRGVAIAAGLVAVGGLAVVASDAGAAPQPTVDQVQTRINQLTSQFDKVSEQFDQASQQLSAAQSRLSQVRVHLNHADAQFQVAQASVAQTGAEQEMQRTEAGIASLKSQLATHKNSLSKLIATEKATLDGLTVPQQQTVVTNSIGANGSSAPQSYSGPTGTQADAAVAFAYNQLGC